MALRTVEQRKKVLHITNKQNNWIGSSAGNSPPGVLQVDRSGEMTSASGRFFMPENQPHVQEKACSSGDSIESRAVSGTKPGKSGKVLHTLAQPGMEAVNNHVEGGEELRESEQILMAMGAAGKRVFRINRRKSLAHQKSRVQKRVTGVVSNRAPDPSSRGKQLAKDLSMSDLLKGFEVIDIEVGRSDSRMTVSGNMVKFNKATATELMHPEYVRMLIDAVNKQVAVQACSEKTRNAIPFSKGKGKQTYAITVKVPAIVVAIQKLVPNMGAEDSLSFHGKLFAEDHAIIYDLTTGEQVKRRGRRKAVEQSNEQEPEAEYMESETNELFESGTDDPAATAGAELEERFEGYEESDDSGYDEYGEQGYEEPDEKPAPKKRRGRPPKNR